MVLSHLLGTAFARYILQVRSLADLPLAELIELTTTTVTVPGHTISAADTQP